MSDCNYVCEESPIGLNLCSQGFLIYTDEPKGAKIIAHIRIKGGNTWCIPSVVGCGGLLRIDWIPSNFLMKGYHKLELSLKDKNGDIIQIPYGLGCDYVCGIEFTLTDDCSKDYLFINQSCSQPVLSEWRLNLHDCTFVLKINNCTWILKEKDMITKVKYNNVEYQIESQPTFVAGGVLAINQDFVDELLAIDDSFTVSLDGNEVVINYNSTYDIDLFTSCNKLDKTCI